MTQGQAFMVPAGTEYIPSRLHHHKPAAVDGGHLTEWISTYITNGVTLHARHVTQSANSLKVDIEPNIRREAEKKIKHALKMGVLA